ncbi:hypothetical protein [Lacticaseibacillus daqingensis]|uniref:hypothetical protein n=1 Tax=Lacticaseibacillus daqingensis TaxID=2486014 RepID=UPI000F79024B|nr:hypothetical protein [Lacticaseibacillus daqingensis]
MFDFLSEAVKHVEAVAVLEEHDQRQKRDENDGGQRQMTKRMQVISGDVGTIGRPEHNQLGRKT